MNAATDSAIILNVLDTIRNARQPVPKSKLAERFDLTEAALDKIINNAFYQEFFDTDGEVLPDRMFDFDMLALEGGMVSLTRDPFQHGIPVRIYPRERETLILGLQVLRDAAPHRLAADIDCLLEKLNATLPIREGDDEAIYGAVSAALDAGTQLDITYASPRRSAPARRVIDPVRVVQEGDHKYLRAYCYLRERMTWFRIDRILEIVPLDTRVAAHVEDEREGSPHGTGDILAEVAVHRLVLPEVRPYFGDQPIRVPEPDDDGFVRLRMAMYSIDEAVEHAAAYGGRFVIEGPPELRAAVAAGLRALLNRQQAASSTAAA